MPVFTRRQQEELTQRAQAIIEDDLKRYQERFPRLPPRISIRECQEAIGIAGGIPMTLQGEERRITEVRTRGGGNTRWFSGELRMTVSGTGQAHPAGESHNRKASKRVRPELGLPRGA